ncbi:MAG TPA: PASTA domain-containing protein [Gaiellaceae bacterium]|nr:PASTA domain-containing protein [Gaiellaceae bacterium]
MSSARIRVGAAAALAGALVVGGLVVTPAAHAAITGSQITTPTDPSFFIADESASTQTFAIAGTTSGGNPATNTVDVNCYSGGSFVRVARNVSLKSDGSFSIPKANLNNPLDLTCRLRAVPAGTSPANLTAFHGPVIGVGERDLDKVAGGRNNGTAYDFYLDAQQQSGAFDYASLGGCGLEDGYLYDAAFALTTTTFICNAGLPGPAASTARTRSDLQIDGANAYPPYQAFFVNGNAPGFPALTETYQIDSATGDVVIHETDPLVKCADPTYPPNTVSCATFVGTGVTDDRTITQDHDGHISWITDVFTSTDGKPHSLDLLWDNNQQFRGQSGDSSQVEYEFPGETAFSTHATGDTVALPSAPGTIFIRMHGAPDGDTGTGRGAIVYDRPATAATFTSVQSFDSEFALHQTGEVPAGGSTRFRFAYVQDFQASNVASMAQTASSAFLEKLAVSRSGHGKGEVTSSPGGIDCGKDCANGYAYGTAVTLKAAAAKGSRFAGWSGACKGRHACTVTTDADVAVDAKFVLQPCVVPNVVGKTLTAAKLALEKALCSVGKVRQTASSTVTKGRVVSQRPKRGRRLRQHARIDLVVGKG